MSTFPTAIDPNVQPAEPVAAAPAPGPQDAAWWDTPDPAPADSQGSAPAPQAQPPDQWYLRSSDGKIVYRTAEEAVRGLGEKDRVIEQQKAELAQFRAMQSQVPSTAQAANAPAAAAKQQGLVAALAAAVENKDMTFDQAMTAFVQQQSQAALEPMQPLLQYAAMNRALDEAAHNYDPNIPAFVRSPAYARTLNKWQGLKTVIDVASSAPHLRTADGRTYGDLLPEFLAQVYMVAKAAAPAAQPVQRPAPQSATPPQVVRPNSPQGYAATPQPALGQYSDPFTAAWANVPDIPLTREALGG